MSKLTVRQLMKTPAVVVLPHTTLLRASSEMTRAGVHHLPVVDRNGVLLGILSEREIDRAMMLMTAVEGHRPPLTVGDVVAGDPLRVGPDLPAHHAATMVIESRIDGLPVVDLQGHLLGILTATDLIEVAREALLGVEPAMRARA